MKTFIIIYYKLMKWNAYEKDRSLQRWYTYMQMLFMIMFNLLTILAFLGMFLETNLVTFNGWLDNNAINNRLIKIPLLILPFAILLHLLIVKNKERINRVFKELDSLSDNERKKRTRPFWMFIVASIVFLLVTAVMIYIKNEHIEKG